MIKGKATTILSENSEKGYYDSKRLSRVRETHFQQLILSGIVVYIGGGLQTLRSRFDSYSGHSELLFFCKILRHLLCCVNSMRCPRGFRPMGSNSNSFHATLRMSDQSIQELMADLQKVLILNIRFHDELRSIF